MILSAKIKSNPKPKFSVGAYYRRAPSFQLIVGLYVTRGDGVGQKSEAVRRQSVVSGFLRHKWKKSITAGNTRGAMVSKNTHCIALQNMLTVTVIVTLQRVTLGNTRGEMVSKNTHCIALQNMLTVTVAVT